MKFTELNLHENLLKGIAKAGYENCTPVQEQVLKASLDGQDLYVQSKTGTGKTAAFLISIIQELLSNADKNKKALIMVPTRELAVQVEEEAKTLCSGSKLKCASFYGGVGYGKQTELLKKNIDILVGTPGRLIDLQESGAMDLSKVGYLVVDEADRMFDMGFYPELRKLIKVLPSQKDRQTMLFSATLNTYVKNLAWEYTENAKEIEIEPENITVEEIAQELIHVSSDDKMKLLLGILKRENPESVIIFCNTKRSCEVIAKRLQINQINADFIIGDLPQATRLKVLNLFKEGKLSCLVATDVAARGIDVSDLAMVINYDLPNESENYVHRIGRTARAVKSGKAYTFCSEQDVYNLPAIERYIEMSIPSHVAYPEQMLEDKSAGVYIKTEFGHEDYDSKRKSSSSSYNKKGYKDGSSRKGHNGKNRNYDKKDYKKKYDKKSKDVDFAKMENMSFEDRMKIYKEKYGKSTVSNTGNTKKYNNSYNKNNKNNKNKNYYKNNKNSKNNYSNKKPNANVQQKTVAKKGLFARIKAFFGK
mgnify:CR=1 FL=1